MVEKNPSVDDIIRKYKGKIESQIDTTDIKTGGYSREYATFKAEMAPQLSRYERLCKSLGNVIKLKVSVKDQEKIKKYSVVEKLSRKNISIVIL